jgi:DNA mismatch repair protein MutS
VESGGNLTFLHSVEDGPASQSYGIQVAKLAGVPTAVVNAARRKLVELENAQVAQAGQGDLFAGLPPTQEPETSPALDKLAATDPDSLTPREALDLLYELKRLAK